MEGVGSEAVVKTSTLRIAAVPLWLQSASLEDTTQYKAVTRSHEM